MFSYQRRREVRVFLRGGLGNQLFQIQLGLAIASCGISPVFDDTFLRNLHGQPVNSSRGTNYARALGLPTAPETHWALWIFKRVLLSASYFAASRMKSGTIRGGPLLSSHHAVTGEDAATRKWVDAPGLRNPLDPPALHAIKELLERLFEGDARSEQISVGMHVRLGDYLDMEHIYGKICYHFFQEALELANSAFDPDTKRNVIVFSDSPLLFELNSLSLGSNIALEFAHDLELDIFNEFRLLSSARVIICSNSSFSWWAAALSSAEVFVPEPFEGPSFALPQYVLSQNWRKVHKCKQC